MLTLAGMKATKELQGKGLLLKASGLDNSTTGKTPEEILAEYRKNIASISAYAATVQNLNITIYGALPNWYTEDFKEKFVASKAHAQSWLNDILSRLTEVPESIIAYDKIYQMYSGDIVDYCKTMLKDPRIDLNKPLIDSLNKLIDSVSQRKALVVDLEEAINAYISTLDKDKKFFDETYTSACDTRDVDREQLKDFQKMKTDLEDEIKYLQDVATGTAIAGGVLLTATPIGFACGPVGIIIGIIVSLAALSTLIASIIENEKCQRKRTELEICINQMNEMTKTVLSLESFCSELDKIICAATAAKSAAEEIRKLWEELGTQMAQLVEVLEMGEKDATQKLYTKLVSEVEDADKEWKEIVETAEIYAKLNIEVQNTVINVEKSA